MTGNDLIEPMPLIERDGALHEQFKAAAETLRQYMNELCDEIIPVMEGDSESCEFFEPGMTNFMAPLYDKESEFGECMHSSVLVFSEMNALWARIMNISDELRDMRQGPKE